MVSLNRISVSILLFLTTIPALAGLSPKLAEWGTGPAQWIMTADEKRDWRKITTDTDAASFIDLFWARRDPSVGTALNEYKNEFESRVAYSDERFTEKRKRGALTDRGRVYIVLGAPTNMGGEARQNDVQQGIASGDDTGGGRQRGARESWIWERADARKFDMSRIEVLFIEDPVTRRTQRDPRKADFGLAGVVAIRKAVVNPDLTAVPAWAPVGGLDPVSPLDPDDEIQEAAPGVSSTTDGAVSVPMPEAPPAMASNTPGASRLTLLRGGSLDARSANPFAVKSETTFKIGHDVLWAVQFCSAKAEVPKLKSMLLINGPVDGTSTEQATRQKDAKPERMTAQLGCYVLQGMVPASKLTPGRYRLSILIDDDVNGDTYTMKGEFRLE